MAAEKGSKLIGRIAFISIVSAVMITMIAIGIQNPANGRRVTNEVPFYQGFGAMMSIVFSFGMSLPRSRADLQH